jgi:oxygen-independent coproporphyrinogen-3 oxidase
VNAGRAVAGAGVEAATLRELDRSGPRYTSYPTSLEFHPGIGAVDYLERLDRADQREPDAALSLYVHLPFCEKACDFCACHFIATERRDVARRYLGYLEREAALVAARLPRRRTIDRMQWGGGTPTYFAPDELERLHDAIARQFRFSAGAEIAIEVDPRVTTLAHLATLRGLGFNRLSMGVQDFTPEVQEAIGRRQTFAETQALVAAARAQGFGGGINFDLVHGLPRQDRASFARNLDQVLELRPDRVALYSFAYVPWARANQRRIDPATLPTGEPKLALALEARQRLLGAGYEPVGIDHYALPADELARASRAARLDRNFMGYTPGPASSSIAFGITGIGELEGAYFQNARKLSDYSQALDAGRLPIERGFLLDEDDLRRQHVIRRLLCTFRVDKEEFADRFDADFDRTFATDLSRLRATEEACGAELASRSERELVLTETGRLFARNVCMHFDRHLEARRANGSPAFSRTV